MKSKLNIPKEVLETIRTLKGRGFLAYIVGGCVRDALLDIQPKDWDVATNARPEQIQGMFPDSVYENDFGTVGVKTDSIESNLKIIEITTFRTEAGYSDSRHPDKVEFAKTLEEDVSRRDFTINAMAIEIGDLDSKKDGYEIIDLYEGQKDLENKIIRTVDSPDQRFSEDALRMLRAVRFACQLGFLIEEKTEKAIQKNSKLLAKISKERIRDEFEKIILSDQAAWGVQMLYALGLLEYVVPELIEGVGIGQNKHHIFSVWEHNLRALDYAVSKKYSLEVRLASLLHDVGKPRTKNGDGPNSTFYAHEIVGGKMTRKILENLKFSKKITDYVTHLVRYHLFYYNVGEVSEAGVRRFIARVGEEYIDDLIKIREADRIGSGVPKAIPYKLRHLLFMIDKVKRDPVSPKVLKIDGNRLMEVLNISPGPKIGFILNILLEEVIDDPQKNDAKYLEERAAELAKMSEKELEYLNKKAKETKMEFESGVEQEMKKKHRV